jgi:hypothetical protein
MANVILPHGWSPVMPQNLFFARRRFLRKIGLRDLDGLPKVVFG